MKFNINSFYEEGISIFDNESPRDWDLFKNNFEKILGTSDFENIHQKAIISNINNIRLNVFESINSIDSWETHFISMAKNVINQIIGCDVAIQRRLNLNIQLPNDFSSKLDMHADLFSGESPFEVVIWVPLTRAYKSNGMYYFDRETSKKIYSELVSTEHLGIESLRKKYWNQRKELDVDSGKVVIFSSTVFHGNVPNVTNSTRISMNCRLKNLFHPEGSRDLGFFHKMHSLGPLAKIGIEFCENEFKF
jgi:sporadic carbohydrate cluster 2OG-Fe(II) oxygenase